MDWTTAAIAGIGVLLLGHCSFLHAQNCTDFYPCFQYNFGACLRTDFNVTDDYPVEVTLLSTDVDETVLGSDSRSLLFSSVLRLLCSENKPGPDTAGPPYCVVEREEVEEEWRDECENCSCTVVVFWVVDRWQGSLISSSAVAEFLNRPSTRVALRLAGLSVLSASTEQEGNDDSTGGLYDVPLVSWVFVGLGILVAAFVLLQPLWWDRFLGRIGRQGK